MSAVNRPIYNTISPSLLWFALWCVCIIVAASIRLVFDIEDTLVIQNINRFIKVSIVSAWSGLMIKITEVLTVSFWRTSR